MNESVFNEARALAANVASEWNGGKAVLDRILAAQGDPRTSPWGALRALGPEGIVGIFPTPEDQAQVSEAVGKLTRYLTATTPFDRIVAEDPSLGVLAARPIAYFCAEFGLANWLPTYSGGLGILAGDVLKESSDLGLPMVAIGLFYRHGYFYQELDEGGRQREVYPTLDPADLPLTLMEDAEGQAILVPVPLQRRTVFARIWRLQVGRTALYLLDTDVVQNEPEDRDITAGLYTGDQEMRIRQEIVLGIGGVRALHALGIDPSVYSMNEGHAAFLGVELLAEALRSHDLPVALRRTRSRIVYTNHTVVPAGNDIFPTQLVTDYLDPYVSSTPLGLNGLVDLADSGGQFSMAVLAFQLSGRANAVSRLHGEVIPREWPGYAVEVVTNGVHIPTWLGAEMHRLLDTYVPQWWEEPDWSLIAAIPDDELWRAHADQRRAMVHYVNERQSAQLSDGALTLVWARRFTEYKRAGLLATDLARLARILSDADHPVQLVISGKSHPRDEGGKDIMQHLIGFLKSDAHVAPRVAFVPNYDITTAQYLVGGADVWLNTPRKPLEASGTSGMKSSDNGGLQLTVQDGWAAEVEWWDVGWGIEGRGDSEDASQLYSYIETDVVPTFYHRESGVPRAWAARMKNTMQITLSRYSARRMMLEYLHKLYMPLISEQASTAPTLESPVEQQEAHPPRAT